MVTMIPPGCRPGITARATAPMISPKTIHAITPMRSGLDRGHAEATGGMACLPPPDAQSGVQSGESGGHQPEAFDGVSPRLDPLPERSRRQGAMGSRAAPERRIRQP